MSETARQRLDRAEAETRAARAQLSATLDQIQSELSPANLVNRALDEFRARSQAIADNALATLVSRPVLTALLASLAGVLLRHRPMVEAIVRLLLGSRATGGKAKHSRRGRPQSNKESEA